MMNKDITYITGNENIIDDIKELWEGLNRHHLEKSRDFKHHFENFTFQKRKESLINKSKNGEIYIVIAVHMGCNIGYCVSSAVNSVGEIESIYIKPEYRKCRVGTALMESSLKWIKANNTNRIILGVAAGNEEAFGFYSKFGFVPVSTKLQYILD